MIKHVRWPSVTHHWLVLLKAEGYIANYTMPFSSWNSTLVYLVYLCRVAGEHLFSVSLSFENLCTKGRCQAVLKMTKGRKKWRFFFPRWFSVTPRIAKIPLSPLLQIKIAVSYVVWVASFGIKVSWLQHISTIPSF